MNKGTDGTTDGTGKARKTYVQGWTLYPWSMIGHHVQGALSGAGVTLTDDPRLVNPAWMLLVIYVAYQGYSVLRKNDSPGLDIADFMVGFGAAAGAVTVGRLLI